MATLQMKIDRVHAEFLAGNAVSSTVTTHSVVARDGSGNVHANKFKSANMELTHNVPTSARTSDTVFYSSFDGVIRKNTAAGMRGSLGLNNVNNTGATVAATADKIVLRNSEGDIFAANVFATSNVGIGVTDPDQKLEVRGNIKASYSDTNHGMFLDAGGTLRRDYGGAGAGFHFTNTAIWPTDYLGNYSAGGINFGDSSYRWNNVYTEELNASGEVITGTVNATSYKLTGDTTPHKQSIKNSANLSVGWYRIAENGNAVHGDTNGSRCSARFTIIDYVSSQHSTRTLYAGGTYGNKPFIHLLTNTSFSGDGIISKVRVVEGSTYEGLAVEIYVDTACSTNEIRIVMDDNYQGNGFTMVDFESVVADHSNMNEYELNLNTTFWGMFLDNTTKNICMLEDGNVGIGTASPSSRLTINAKPGHSNNFDFSDIPLSVNYNSTVTSNSNLNDPKSVMILTREGTSSQAFAAGAAFQLSRWENSGTNSRSRLDIALKDTSFDLQNIMTMRSNGNVGINDSTPSYKLSVNGSFRVHGSVATFGSDGLLHINSRSTTHGSETVALQTVIDGRALTDANPGTYGGESRNVLALQPDGGYVGIGTASPGYKLDVGGAVNASGDVTAFSDKRVKTDISKIEDPLNKVCSINGYTYKRIDTKDEKRHTGVIAQEVMKVLPEVVHGSEDTTYSVAYGNMVGLLIEAIKELKLEIDELKKSK